MRIGIIGAGAIAHFLLQQLREQQVGDLVVTSLLVRNEEKYAALADEFHVKLYTKMTEFLQSGIDIVVEAADIPAVTEFVPVVLKEKPVILISVGALANEPLLTELMAITEQYRHRLYLPSGAIGGLDLLQNASALGNVTTVALTTRKPAQSLVDEAVFEERVVFEGTAAEAIQLYPKNMNVSIVLALASLGFEQTTVTLIADPQITQNIHHIAIAGDFGEATIEVKNNPLPANPKTSYLAAMSIMGTLKRLGSQLMIGG